MPICRAARLALRLRSRKVSLARPLTSSSTCRARFSEVFLSVMAERLAMLGGRLVSLMHEQKVGLG